MELFKLIVLLLNILWTVKANSKDQYTPCAVIYDGGGLTASDLVVKGNVPVRKPAGQNLPAQVSTIIVSRGCMLVGYEDTEEDEEVLKVGSSCSADFLDESTVIDTPYRTIQFLQCFCYEDCKNDGYKNVLSINIKMSLLIFFTIVTIF